MFYLRRATLAAAALVALSLASPSAHADTIELEPNDTFATGQIIVRDPVGDTTVRGFRESSPTNDFNDFFRFQATAGEVISLRVNTVGGGDPLLQLLSPAGVELAFNDDCAVGGGGNPADACILNFSVTTTGLYGAGIRGFANFVFTYDFIISGPFQDPGPGPAPVPEPATVLLLGTGLLGAAAGARRRRTARKK